MRLATQLKWSGLGLLVLVLAIVALKAISPRAKPQAPKAPEPLAVDVVMASPMPTAIPIRTQGLLQPKHQVKLSSPVQGPVIHTAAAWVAGAQVTAGELLLGIDATAYREQVEQARARLAAATLLVAEERARAFQAKKEWRQLGNADANALFLREPQLAKAKAEQQAAEAALAHAERNLAWCQVRAPFAGHIQQVYTQLGAWLAPGAPLADLVDPSVALVELRLPERLANQVSALPVAVNFRSVEGQSGAIEWTGQLLRRAPNRDASTRDWLYFAEITATSQAPLRFGTYVQADFLGAVVEAVVKLPVSALYQGKTVFWLEADNQNGTGWRLAHAPVTVLQQDRDWVWLQAPVATEVPYVVRDQGLLQPGMAVARLDQLSLPAVPQKAPALEAVAP
jgi:RND family efflux transporter MFP subunit